MPDPHPDRAASSTASRPAHWLSGWPELLAQWHPVRNRGLQAHDLSHNSPRKIWWKCPHGPDHEWRATATSRIVEGTGCPFCAGRLPSVPNSLASRRPDLAKQWHPTKNGEGTPDRIEASSRHRVWWKCPIAADHEWQLSPRARSRADGGCPFCVRLRASKTASPAGPGDLGAHVPGANHLRREHTRIEQTLVLLASDPSVEETLLVRVLADVAAHLASEENFIYAVIEHEGRSLGRVRELNKRIRILSTKIASGNMAIRWACLQSLHLTFREHARLAEHEVLPALECAIGPAAVEALERRMHELGTGPSSPAAPQAAPGAGPRTPKARAPRIR